MNRSEWQCRIIKACEDAGTYQPYFEAVIETLAGIMERRDEAERKFIESGGESVVEHVIRNGSINMVKNPALLIIDQLNTTALAYWRDLGLTPAGFKRIKDMKVHDAPKSKLEAALEELNKD